VTLKPGEAQESSEKEGKILLNAPTPTVVRGGGEGNPRPKTGFSLVAPFENARKELSEKRREGGLGY